MKTMKLAKVRIDHRPSDAMLSIGDDGFNHDSELAIGTNGTITLLYRITVTGDAGAGYAVTDENATWVGGAEMEGTLPDTGAAPGTEKAKIYVTKTFTADDIVNNRFVNTAADKASDETTDPSEVSESDYTKVTRTFHVEYLNGIDGTVLAEFDVPKGESTPLIGWNDWVNPVTKDLTFIALWAPNTGTEYTVEHYWQNADGTYADEPEQVVTLHGTTGEHVTAGTIAREHYTVGGVLPEADIAADGSTVLKVYYARASYTVTYENGVNGTVFENQTYSVIYESATPAFDGTPTRTGFNFVGWSPAVADIVTGTVTYVAQWQAEVPAPEDSTNGTTELADNPTLAPAPTPAPAPAAPAAAVATPVGPAISGAAPVADITVDDDANPLAAQPEVVIDDDENALAAFDTSSCWVHFWMFIGLAVSLIYGAAVALRRNKHTHDNNDFGKTILGKEENPEGAYLPRGARQMMQ